MRPPTRLLLFVILPLAVAVGGVAWVLERRGGGANPVQVRLPATTQIVRELAAVRWTSPEMRLLAVGGLLNSSSWYAIVPSMLDRPGQTAYYDIAVDSTVNGRSLGIFTRPVSALPVRGDDGLLYAPTGTSEVAAFDIDTRQTVWRTDLKLPVKKIAVHGTRLLGTTPKGAVALDTHTGRVLWTYTSAPPRSNPALDATFACYAAGDTLHVIDAASGKALRQVVIPGTWGRLLVDGGSAYVCGWSATGTDTLAMAGVDLSTGFVRWQWRYAPPDAEADPSLRTRTLFTPVLADGTLYASYANTLCAIDAASGRERWRWAWRAPAATDGRPASPAPPTWRDLRAPAVIGGVVYVPSTDDLSGLDPATGREVWRFEADDRASRVDGLTFGAAGLLFTSVGSPQLRAITDDLHPAPASAPVTPAARGLNLAWATGVASTAALLLIILAVFGWWRTAIALVCLCLCTLTVWGWWRSYAGDDFIGFSDLKRGVPFYAQATRGVTSSRGRLVFGAKHEVWNTAGGRRAIGTTKDHWIWARTPHEEPVATGRGGAAGLLDFRWTRRDRPSGTALGNQSEMSLTLPHWLVALVLGVAPLAWLTGLWRDRRRHPRGHCVNCGYDVRGITGRCPECGWDLPPDAPRPKRRGLPDTR
jgi:outer membrane protein assembly factor BamB